MVYRIQPKRHSRVVYFLRIWCLTFFLTALIYLGGLYLLDMLGDDGLLTHACLPVLLATLGGWWVVRQWGKLDWFNPNPGAYFLTMVEEGLLIEAPARGVSLYLPWVGVGCRRRGDVLTIVYQLAPCVHLSLHGVSGTLRSAVLAELKLRAGKAPLPQVPALPGLPPLPIAVLPPPVPVESTTPGFYTNALTQWQECLRYLMRPGKLAVTLRLVVIATLGFWAGESISNNSEPFVSLMLFWIHTLLAIYLMYKLGRPGWMSLMRVPGPIHMAFTRNEVVEHLAQGGWSRFRLPSPDKATLVQLSLSRCLLLGLNVGCIQLDAAEKLPPALAAYPTAPAPRNRARVVLAALLFALALIGGGFYGNRPTVSELAFRALPATPSNEELRTFAATFYAHGQVLDTPSLIACSLDDEEDGAAGYMLYFTDSAPDPDEDDGRFHLAWETAVLLYPSGRVYETGSWPVDWCPCEDWLYGSMPWETEEEEDEEEP